MPGRTTRSSSMKISPFASSSRTSCTMRVCPVWRLSGPAIRPASSSIPPGLASSSAGRGRRSISSRRRWRSSMDGSSLHYRQGNQEARTGRSTREAKTSRSSSKSGSAFRRAMKRSIAAALRLGAQGIRINVAGRLGGAENRPDGVVSGRPSSAAHAPCRHRLWICRGPYDDGANRCEDVDLPGAKHSRFALRSRRRDSTRVNHGRSAECP